VERRFYASLAAEPGTTPARAAILQCFLHGSERSPYKAVGMAQIDAESLLGGGDQAPALRLLRSFTRRAWRAGGYLNGNGRPGATIRVAVRYKCRSGHLRAWEAHAAGWSLLTASGTPRAGSATRTSKCG